MTIFFAALYWDGPESAAGIVSLHLTEEGAEAAIDAHKARMKEEWREVCEATGSKFEWSDEYGSGFAGWSVEVHEVHP